MRFRFESQTTDGLHVVPEIPNRTPCLIEGRNGIGKTVAVWLLQLIAGEQPFEGAGRQWHSLRGRLGRTTVRIDELQGNETLEFTFTPERWSEDGNPPVILGEWLGEVKLDGRAATVAQAQELLWVQRFAGNEDLDHTLRRRIAIYVENALRTSRTINAAVARVAELLEPLREELESVDAHALADRRQELTSSESAETEARASLDGLLARHEQALSAIAARDRLAAAEDPANQLQQRRRELGEQMGTLHKERKQLEAGINETSEALKRQGDVQATLGEAERTLRYRLKRLRNIDADIERLAGTLDVDPQAEAVSKAHDASTAELAALQERQREIDAGGMTGHLIDTVAGVLDDPTANALNDQTLVVLADRELSVREVHDGMIRRREQLRGEPTPDELQTLTGALARVQRRIALIRDLSGKLTDSDKQTERIQEATHETKQAEENAERAGSRDEKYRADNQRLGVVEEEIDAVTVALTDVHAQLGLEGGQSPEDARTDLEAQLTALGLDASEDLDEVERELRVDIGAQRSAVERAADRTATLRRSVTVMSASVDAAVAALRSEERFSWMRDLLPTDSTGELVLFTRLSAGVSELLDGLDGTRDLVEIVGQLVSGALEDQPMVSNRELQDAVRAVLANELRRGLDTPQIRRLIFDGARIDSIDLTTREMVLTSNGTSSPPRAFETFSTGEQAFAFTQARILELEPSTRPNRLLVLDEFGAFVAADRMPALAEFLRSEQVMAIADQVLVILPLQIDYETELEETTGALRSRYQARVNQLRDCDYYTETLDA
jgi:hypothetical protein